MSDYKNAMKIDKKDCLNYFNSSLNKKNEQQKMLERMLIERGVAPQSIADIACGGGQVYIFRRSILNLSSQ